MVRQVAAKLNSRSFWIAFLIVVASAIFCWYGKIDGGQWVTIASLTLTLWQVGDKAEKVLANGGNS